jgi:hypothetical protein
LEFWKRLKAATLAEAKYLAEGHLTPEQIVAYVDGADMATKLAYEKHLQACDACRKELEVARRAFADEKPEVVHGGESWSERFAKYFRPAFAIPVALALALTIYLLSDKRPATTPDQQANQAPSDSVKRDVIPQATSQRTIAYLLLHPHVALRATTGAERESLLHYDTAKSHVALMLVVPRSNVALTYAIQLLSPSGNQQGIRDSVIHIARGKGADTVKAEISMSSFAGEGGRWQIHVKEVLRPELRGTLEAATHEFAFRVKRK